MRRSASRTFQLLTYRLVQKGPAFKRAIDMSLNVSTGQVTIQYTDDDDKQKQITDRLKLPADLANGMVTTLLGDIDPKGPKTSLSMPRGDTQAQARKTRDFATRRGFVYGWRLLRKSDALCRQS